MCVLIFLLLSCSLVLWHKLNTEFWDILLCYPIADCGKRKPTWRPRCMMIFKIGLIWRHVKTLYTKECMQLISFHSIVSKLIESCCHMTGLWTSSHVSLRSFKLWISRGLVWFGLAVVLSILTLNLLLCPFHKELIIWKKSLVLAKQIIRD